jgi:pimeloyl-ACP methyl ester carboxylesterase
MSNQKQTPKPPILFIHGMWGSANVWQKYVSRFEAQGYETRAITLRHHEVTIDQPAPDGAEKIGLADHVDDILEIVKTYEVPPVLIGHSMGGLLVQLAAAKSDNVHAVIGVCPAPPAGVFALKLSAIRLFSDILFTPMFWKKAIKISYDKARYGFFHNISEAEAREYYKDLRWDSGKAVTQIAFWIFDKTKASKLNETAMHCPVLLLSGEIDRTVVASVVAASAKRYKGGCDYEELPGHSHWPLVEQGWEKVADKCIGWLGEI